MYDQSQVCDCTLNNKPEGQEIGTEITSPPLQWTNEVHPFVGYKPVKPEGHEAASTGGETGGDVGVATGGGRVDGL